MNLFELFILAVGLAMDAFAVSICKGLGMPKTTIKNTFIVGIWFGSFQALMPVFGYFLGYSFRDKIVTVDHWIAFILLFIIGINMIKEAFSKEEEETDASLSFQIMLLMAIATSIDALAVGVSLAFMKVNILSAALFIGIITFLLSAAGVKIGNIFGTKYKSKAEMAGGIILIFLGTKILLEHLGIFPF